MKNFIGLIVVCSNLVTSAIANEPLIWPRVADEPLHPDPHTILSDGKIFISEKYGRRKIFLVSHKALIYRCQWANFRNYDEIWCRKTTAVTK